MVGHYNFFFFFLFTGKKTRVGSVGLVETRVFFFFMPYGPQSLFFINKIYRNAQKFIQYTSRERSILLDHSMCCS